MGTAVLVFDAVRVLGGAEEDEHDEPFGDVVEAVDDVGADEHDRAALDFAIFVAHEDPASAGDHVVDLILGVGPLWIRGACSKHVDADREIVRPDELVVQAARSRELVDQRIELERVHETAG